MSKSKTQRTIEHIETLKEKYHHLDTLTIASRLTNFNKTNDIALAYKQILKERGIEDYLTIVNQSK